MRGARNKSGRHGFFPDHVTGPSPDATAWQRREVVAAGATGDQAPAAARSLAELVQVTAQAVKRERYLARRRAWYAANRAQRLIKQKAYRKAKGEIFNAKRREHYAGRREQMQARGRKSYARNRAARLEQKRKAYATNGDRIRRQARERYQLRREVICARMRANYFPLKCRRAGVPMPQAST